MDSGAEWATELAAAADRGYVAAYRWLRDREEARDACQEAVARALSARDRYDADRPFYAWFYRILKNVCVDRLRRRGRADGANERLARSAGSRSAPTAEQALLRTERERAVDRAIRRLPDDMREIVELRHFQDLAYGEIAAVLDCPMGTVMSRLYRARMKLRELLLDDPEFARDLEPKGGRP